MKRLIIIVLGVLALLVVGVVAAPALIDWNRFKPEIAALVRDATGRKLTLAGDIDLGVLPAIGFSARDVHLANADGFDEPDMVSIEAISGRIALWPLIRRMLVVEQLVIERPDVALAVDAGGRANWRFGPVAAQPDQEPVEDQSDGTLPIADLQLGDVRIEGGSFSYRDDQSGQRLLGRDLDFEVSLPRLAGPLDVKLQLTLNDEPVTLATSIDPLAAALSSDTGRLTFQVESTHLIADVDAEVQVEPLVGLDGQASLRTPSVGALATWLEVPFGGDPGPLEVTAQFDADGPSVALEQLLIEGDQLSARASASLDIGDDITRVTASLESGVLDIDRYLPPRTTAIAPSAIPEAVAPGTRDGDPLAMIPDSPLDLTWLRQLLADIDVSVEGLRVAGYETGSIRFTAGATDGVLEADLAELALYGGGIHGSVHLDASGDGLVARADLTVDNIDAGALSGVAAGNGPPLVGTANGRLNVQTEGRTPRELTQNTTGELDVNLSSGEDVAAVVGELSGLSLNFQRPTTEAGPLLRGNAVYGGEELQFSLEGAEPLSTLLLGEPVTIDAAVESELATASYRGRVEPLPVVSLDGTFDAEVASVSRFARWLGRPLPESGSDLGSLAAHAVLQSNGTSGEIEEAWVRGEGISLEATGEFDATGDVTRFDMAVQGDVLDVDRYLPLARGDETDAGSDGGAQAAAPGAGDDPLAALSKEPIDRSVLHDFAGQVELSLAGIRAFGIRAGAIRLVAAIQDGRFDLQLDRVELAEGVVTAALRVNDADEDVVVEASASFDDMRLDDIDAILAERGINLEGAGAAELAVTSSGRSVREIAAGASGSVKISLPRMLLDVGPIASASDIQALVELAGVDARTSLEASADFTSRAEQQMVALALDGEFGSLSTLLAGREVPLDVTLRTGDTTLHVKGRALNLGTAPQPDLAIELEGRRLSDLSVLAGVELPDILPFAVAASVRTEGEVHRIDDLAVRLGGSDLAGTVQVEIGEIRPRVVANLQSDLIDLVELMPAKDPAAAERPDDGAEVASQVIPDDPLPLETLRALDAKIDLAAALVRTGRQTVIEDLTARLTLLDGRLELAPFTGRTAGGAVQIATTLDGQQQPAGFTFDFEAQDLIMGTFSDLLRPSGETEGRVDADIALTGVGNSPRAIAATLDGRANLLGEGGAVESSIVKVMAIGITDVLDPFFGEEEENTFIECFVFSVDFDAGVGTLRQFLVSFPALSIGGVGTINLPDETLDLEFATDSKNQSLVSFAVPFDVTGPLAAPVVRPDTAGSLQQAAKGAGLAAMFLNPITGPVAAAAKLGATAAADAAEGMTDNKCVAAIRTAGAAGEAGKVAPSAPEEASGDEDKTIVDGLKDLFGGGSN